MNRFAWAIHFLTAHKGLKSMPSLSEMLMYESAFKKIAEEHFHLHLQYYTGHEHDDRTGLVVPGRTK